MRRVIWIPVVAVLLILAAVPVAPALVDWNIYRDELAARLSALTGRPVTIDGPLTVRVWGPELQARDLRAPGLTVATLAARIDVLALLGGDLALETVTLTGVGADLDAGPVPMVDPSLGRVAIAGGHLTLAGRTVTDVDLVVDPGPPTVLRGTGRLGGRAVRLDLSAEPRGADLRFTGTLAWPDLPASVRVDGWRDGQDGLRASVKAAGRLADLWGGTSPPMTVSAHLGGTLTAPELTDIESAAPLPARGRLAWRDGRPAGALRLGRSALDDWRAALPPGGVAGPLPTDLTVTAPLLDWHEGVIRDVRLSLTPVAEGVALAAAAGLPGNGTFKLTGRFPGGQGDRFAGRFDLASAAPARTLAWLRGRLAPSSGGPRVLRLAGPVAWQGDRLDLADIQGRLDGGAIRGAAVVLVRDRPALGLGLSIDRLDTAWLGPLPDRAAVVADLGAFDANLRLDVGTLVAADRTLRGLAARGRLVDGHLDLESLAVGDAGGGLGLAVSGSLADLADGPTGTLAATVTAEDLGPVLAAWGLGGNPGQIGPVQADLRLEGRRGLIEGAATVAGVVAGDIDLTLRRGNGPPGGHVTADLVAEGRVAAGLGVDLGPLTFRADGTWGAEGRVTASLAKPGDWRLDLTGTPGAVFTGRAELDLGSAGRVGGDVRLDRELVLADLDGRLDLGARKPAILGGRIVAAGPRRLSADLTVAHAAVPLPGPRGLRDHQALELDWLGWGTADLTVSGTDIILAGLALDRLDLTASLSPGRLDVPRAVGWAGAGRLTLDGALAREGADLVVAVNGRAVDLPVGEGRLAITGRGRSTYDLGAGLKGTVDLGLRDLSVRDLDLCGVLAGLPERRSLQALARLPEDLRAPGPTRIRALAGQMRVRNGRIDLNDVRAETDCAQVTLSGQVDLPAWRAAAEAWIRPDGIDTVPLVLRVTGPLEAPDLRLENLGAVQRALR